jgi:anti-sigma B factor antagonist
LTELTYVTRHEATHVVVCLTGELDLDSRSSVEAALSALPAGSPGHIVLDMSGLTFCDCSGLAVLVAAAARQADGGGSLRLVNATGQVARMITLCELDDLLARPVR